MRIFWLLLFGLSLIASQIDDRIVSLIGKRAYEQNRLILDTIFSKSDRFKKDGIIDIVAIAKVLKRLGLLETKLPQPQNQEIIFSSYDHPALFFRLCKEALKETLIYRYAITQIQKDEDGIVMAISLVSERIPDPIVMGDYLQRRGVKILGLERIGQKWRYLLDLSDAHIAAKRVDDHLKIKTKKPLWIEVSQKKSLTIASQRGNHWHPLIFVYDRFLHPLMTIQKRVQTKKMDLSLPKGSYYIKISDRFTLKNMKNGFAIDAK